MGSSSWITVQPYSAVPNANSMDAGTVLYFLDAGRKQQQNKTGTANGSISHMKTMAPLRSGDPSFKNTVSATTNSRQTGVYQPQIPPILQTCPHFCMPPFHLFTCVLTKKRQTPIAQATGLSALSHFPRSVPAFLPPDASFQNSPCIPAFEMPSRKPDHMPEAKTHFQSHKQMRSQGLSEQQRNYKESMPGRASRFPTALNLAPKMSLSVLNFLIPKPVLLFRTARAAMDRIFNSKTILDILVHSARTLSSQKSARFPL